MRRGMMRLGFEVVDCENKARRADAGHGANARDRVRQGYCLTIVVKDPVSDEAHAQRGLETMCKMMMMKRIAKAAMAILKAEVAQALCRERAAVSAAASAGEGGRNDRELRQLRTSQTLSRGKPSIVAGQRQTAR